MKKIIVVLIKIYQYILSPIIGQNCRYFPNCSSYAIIAVERHGSLIGLWMAIKRIVKCNPWGGSGIDEVPKK